MVTVEFKLALVDSIHTIVDSGFRIECDEGKAGARVLVLEKLLHSLVKLLQLLPHLTHPYVQLQSRGGGRMTGERTHDEVEGGHACHWLD